MKQRQDYMKTPTSGKSRCVAASQPWDLHSHSSSLNAAMTLRELYSSNNFHRDCSLRPASLAASVSGIPLAMRPRTSADEALEVATLVVNGAAPIADDRAMPGNDALGGNAQQRLQVGEKAANAAIDDRHMLDEQQIAGKQGRSCVIEDRQIVVGMPRLPGLQRQLRPPRSICISSSTSSVGGTILTSSMSASPSTARNALR